jgi:hypothetical protein
MDHAVVFASRETVYRSPKPECPVLVTGIIVMSKPTGTGLLFSGEYNTQYKIHKKKFIFWTV